MAGLGFAVLDRGNVLMGLCRSVVDGAPALAALVSREVNLVARIENMFTVLIDYCQLQSCSQDNAER